MPAEGGSLGGAAAARDGHVYRTGLWAQEAVVDGRRAVAHDGALAAGQDRAHEAAEWPGIGGSDRVDAAVELEQPMVLESCADLIRAQPRGQQLATRNHPMLPRRKIGDDFVRLHKVDGP